MQSPTLNRRTFIGSLATTTFLAATALTLPTALRALDSTGGFNQVIVAAKALVEYGAELNLVADHA